MKAIIINRIILIAAVCTALFILHCAGPSGGGSEAGNARITGRVLNTQGSPAGNVVVTVHLSEFDPGKKDQFSDFSSDTTGIDGMFGLTVRKGCTYTIQAVLITTLRRALITGVEVKDTDITTPQCTLNVPGAVKIKLSDGIDKTLGYVYVPGTTILTFLNEADSFAVLDSVPSGSIPAVCYSSKSASASAVIRYNVPVFPGDTTVVHNSSWKYGRRLFLNTMKNGADVSSDIYDFPVLVRLTAENFNFDQAKTDGGDLRFEKADGTPLPYEIERWDAMSQAAEVWVKVDTIRGSDSSQFIELYWGNPTAISESNGAGVFDLSGGFEGVWHLNETSGTMAADASHNGFAGTYMGGLPRGELGPSGICQNIARPDTDYIELGNVLNPGMKNFAIGIWLKRGTLGTQQALIAKTNGNAPSAIYGYLLNFDSDNFPHLYMASGGTNWFSDSTFNVLSNLPITDSTTWHYVFVVIDRSANSLCKMYIDGIDRTGNIGGDITHISSVSNVCNLHIGTENDNNCSFSGAIGEITFALTMRSADWVKLCYMNQKEQGVLVNW